MQLVFNGIIMQSSVQYSSLSLTLVLAETSIDALEWSPCGKYLLGFSKRLLDNQEILICEPNWGNVTNYLINSEDPIRNNQVGIRELRRIIIIPELDLNLQTQIIGCRLVQVENSLLVCCAFKIVDKKTSLQLKTEVGLWKLFFSNKRNKFKYL